jgi:hypothetical protein
MVTLGLLALSRIPGAGIVNFVRANPAQGNECGDTHNCCAKFLDARFNASRTRTSDPTRVLKH